MDELKATIQLLMDTNARIRLLDIKLTAIAAKLNNEKSIERFEEIEKLNASDYLECYKEVQSLLKQLLSHP